MILNPNVIVGGEALDFLQRHHFRNRQVFQCFLQFAYAISSGLR